MSDPVPYVVNTPWGPMTPDLVVTDDELYESGELRDIRDWGVLLHDRPVKSVSSTLITDLLIESGGGVVGPAEIKAIVNSAVDTSEEDEPAGFLFEARTPWADTIGARASGRDDRIWIERSGDGWVMYYPDER